MCFGDVAWRGVEFGYRMLDAGCGVQIELGNGAGF